MFGFVPVPCCFDDHSFVALFEVWETGGFPKKGFALIPKNCFAILYLSVCHVDFRITCFSFCGLMVVFGIMPVFLYFGVL